jgi:hypothetical protein
MSLTLAGVIGVPLVMALGLFLILRLSNKKETREDSADVSEEQ